MMEFGGLVYIGGLIMLIRKHMSILMMLFSLEYMMLGLMIMLILIMKENLFEFISYFMVIMVIEASLGLGLLVLSMMMGKVIMYNNNDLLKW